MVSISGYQVAEYILMVAATYVLLLLYTAIFLVRSWIDEQAGLSVFKRSYSVLLLLCCFLFVTGLYFSSVRVGTIMFVNGIFATLLMLEVKRVISYGNPFKSEATNEQRA